MTAGEQPQGCQLCGVADHLTFHHLIPKRVHGKTWVRKRYSRDALARTGIWLCRLCHRFIHRQFDEQTLAREFSKLESLQANEAVQRHVVWAAKQRRVAGPVAR